MLYTVFKNKSLWIWAHQYTRGVDICDKDACGIYVMKVLIYHTYDTYLCASLWNKKCISSVLYMWYMLLIGIFGIWYISRCITVSQKEVEELGAWAQRYLIKISVHLVRHMIHINLNVSFWYKKVKELGASLLVWEICDKNSCASCSAHVEP